MSKVTKKLQVTLPVRVARQYKIEPGSQVLFEPAGAYVRMVPVTKRGIPGREVPLEERVRRFQESVARQRAREADLPKSVKKIRRVDRGWKREDLYDRGRPS